MKQVIQNYKTGELQLVEVPVPALKKGFVLVQNIASLISAGTEKYMIGMAKKSLLGKARARPDLVKQVIAKLKSEGIIETYKAVMARLDAPVPLGYSCAGEVLESSTEEFKRGDRVACAGSGYASHAEVVCVPVNLCVHIPRRHVISYSLLVNREKAQITNNQSTINYITFEEGAFVALGGIALEAVRLARPELGERIAVIGLGLLGQITVQLLHANGCHVFGIDIDEEKTRMAKESGCEGVAISGKTDVVAAGRQFAPQGFDAVIIMAATRSNEPLELAAELARERGRIIAGGLVGLEIPRKIFFEKELEFAVSRAWGAGIFDLKYVEKNIDYPYAYARWTAKRNMEEFLNQIALGNVDVKRLISHRFKIEDAMKAYEMILKGKERYMGVVIEYGESGKRRDGEREIGRKTVRGRMGEGEEEKESYKLLVKGYSEKKRATNQQITNNIAQPTPCIGVIGAGLFATGTILPILKKMKDVRLKTVATATGIKGQHAARKFEIENFTTDYKEILNDKDINLVFIMTRHGSHAKFVIEALKAGKHVFVEKPLCINQSQLKEIVSTYQSLITNNHSPIVMVGFNRRFSPFSTWLKEKFRTISEPLSIHITCNAGYVPPDHWVHDPVDGAGRIIGEVCHFVDLIQFFTDSNPVEVYAQSLDAEGYRPSDNVAITMKMANGAIGQILYIASGAKRYPRERVEIFGGGAVGVIDNFRRAEFISGSTRKTKRSLLGLDRGHKGELEALIRGIKEGKNPVPFDSYIATTLTTFRIEESIRCRKAVRL